jgi:hypothetical protein
MPSAALERHPATSCSALRGITASIAREPESVQVAYVLEGDIDRLRIPPPRPPRIAEHLWQHTCCEIFIARESEPGYRELNLSPSGEWAAYAFAGYRAGARLMNVRPEIRTSHDPKHLQLSAAIAIEDKGKLRIGLSAVIEDDAGQLSYWALRHPPGKPDFHHAVAFAMELDAVRH